jgi:DNA-binding NarL/FixJ family response regulator
VKRRVLLADDHPLFRGALRTAVSRVCPDFIIEEVDSLEGARAALAKFDDVEIVLLDLKLPDSDGLVGLLTLRAEFPQVPVVVVSATEDIVTISNVVAAGAQGFIPKSASLVEISEGLDAVLEGDVWTPKGASLVPPTPGVEALATLSPAQARIMVYLRRGLLNKQIAYELGVTEATVKAHMTGAFKKLGVISRTQALIMLAQTSSAAPVSTDAAPAG